MIVGFEKYAILDLKKMQNLGEIRITGEPLKLLESRDYVLQPYFIEKDALIGFGVTHIKELQYPDKVDKKQDVD